MSLCLATGAGIVRLAVAGFTLAWTHSVERTRWEEDWIIARDGLVLAEARVQGSGAGMEPGEGARLEGGFWRWRPNLPVQPSLVLRRSDALPEGWTLCAAGACRRVADRSETAETVTLSVCD